MKPGWSPVVGKTHEDIIELRPMLNGNISPVSDIACESSIYV